jgi:hypothetical protein
MTTINSPIERFSGTVTLIDPVPYPVYIEWEKAVGGLDNLASGEAQFAMFEAIQLMVEKWNIANFDIMNPPATPRTAVVSLLAWLIDEIGRVINGTDPNA